MDLKFKRPTTLLLLMFSTYVHTEGSWQNLRCVNDYASVINCSLQSSVTTERAQWLRLEHQDEEEELLCPLSRYNDHLFCSIEYDAFVDTDVYKIWLCHEDGSCDLLDEEHYPVENIKPNSPCCLTLKQNSSQHRFTWKSTYEKLTNYTDLPTELSYELHLYQKGQLNETHHNIYTDETTFTVDDELLKPGSEYVAEVRSSPNRSLQSFYRGQWSDWSTALHWTTQPTEHENNPPAVFNLKMLLIPTCLLVTLFLSLCFTSFKKWRQKVFIPSPEPYFHTLYTDCHGDFKTWVIMEKTIHLPKTEQINPIENIFEREDVCEAAPNPALGSDYANLSGPECVSPEPGLTCAVSTSGLDSATSSCTSACLSPRSRIPAEGDSGCWLSSERSLEQDHLWYCNDYCTLSTFQQSALGKASGSLQCTTCVIET